MSPRRVRGPVDTMTVEHAWSAYQSAARGTVAGQLPGIYRTRIAPKLGAQVISALDPRTLRRWERWMLKDANGGKGYRADTVRSTWDFLRVALERTGVALRPWTGFSLSHARPARSVGKAVHPPGDIGPLLAACVALDARLEPALPDLPTRVAVLIGVGLRLGEARALAWDDLNDDCSRLSIRHSAPEGWVKAFEGIGEGTRRRYPVSARPRSATKRPRVLEIAAGTGVHAALVAQRTELERRGLYRDDGPVFPQADGAFRHRHFVEPRVLKELGRRLPGVGRETQLSLQFSGALLLMDAPALDVIRGPRAFSLRTLDELAGRVEWRNRLASYTWIERLLGSTDPDLP